MLMSAPPSSRRASTTPGLPHLQTRYRLHKLRRYLALLFAPAIAGRLLPPRQLTVRALLATHSASPPIANENRCREQKSFRGLHDFSHATGVLPHIALVHIPRGQRGSERNARQGGGGYSSTPRGQAPEPPNSLIFRSLAISALNKLENLVKGTPEIDPNLPVSQPFKARLSAISASRRSRCAMP